MPENRIAKTMKGNGVAKWLIVWIGCVAFIMAAAFLSSLGTHTPPPVRQGNCITTTVNYGWSGNLPTTHCRWRR